VEGIIYIPAEPATGRLVFTNITDQPISIPVGTIVRTEGEDPVRFTTTQSGNLPAGFEERITLPARAVQSGSKGNLPAGSLIAIEGPLGLNVTATNPSPTQGGKDRPVNAPVEDEYIQLFDELSRELYFEAIERAGDLTTGDDLLLTISPQPSDVLENEFDPVEPQPSDHLSLRLSLEFTAWYVSEADLEAFAEGVLDANLPAVMVPVPDSLQISQTTDPKLSGEGSAKWKIKASRRIHVDADETKVANLVLGMPTQQAADLIASSFELADAPQIRVNPDWWPRIPLIPFRISINISHQ